MRHNSCGRWRGCKWVRCSPERVSAALIPLNYAGWSTTTTQRQQVKGTAGAASMELKQQAIEVL